MDVSTCHSGYAALERLQRHRRFFHRSSECGVALSRSRRTPGSSLEPERPNTGFRVPFSRFWGLHLTQVSTKENINMSTLSYIVTEPATRSPFEKGQPHGKQSESTTACRYETADI